MINTKKATHCEQACFTLSESQINTYFMNYYGSDVHDNDNSYPDYKSNDEFQVIKFFIENVVDETYDTNFLFSFVKNQISFIIFQQSYSL